MKEHHQGAILRPGLHDPERNPLYGDPSLPEGDAVEGSGKDHERKLSPGAAGDKERRAGRGLGRPRKASAKARAVSRGVGGSKTRGWVTTRRNPASM